MFRHPQWLNYQCVGINQRRQPVVAESTAVGRAVAAALVNYQPRALPSRLGWVPGRIQAHARSHPISTRGGESSPWQGGGAAKEEQHRGLPPAA